MSRADFMTMLEKDLPRSSIPKVRSGQGVRAVAFSCFTLFLLRVTCYFFILSQSQCSFSVASSCFTIELLPPFLSVILSLPLFPALFLSHLTFTRALVYTLTLTLFQVLGGTFEPGNVAFDFGPEIGPGGALYCPGIGGDVGTEKDTDGGGGGKVSSAVGAVTSTSPGKGQGQGQPVRVPRDDSARVTEEMR